MEFGMRDTPLDIEGLGNLLGCLVDSSPGGCNGHQEYRDGPDSRIDGLAKLEDGLTDITYLDYADN